MVIDSRKIPMHLQSVGWGTIQVYLSSPKFCFHFSPFTGRVKNINSDYGIVAHFPTFVDVMYVTHSNPCNHI